ncbi:MAG: C40 family peptidase [Acidaminococcaceae bacterium]
MGSRIPVEGKVLLMPVRDAADNLKITKISARYDKSLHAGYLSYTNNNLIKQAFAFIGDSYGWGGLRESVDCSSFVADVYRTFGVELPRNADEQEEASAGNYMELLF